MTDAAADVPAPGLVAAQFVLGSLASERAPWWAACWLADGNDGEALRELAGLAGDDNREIWDLLPRALADMSIQIPSHAAAVATVSFYHFANLCLTGRASERWVAQKVEEMVTLYEHDQAILDLPLGRLYGIENAWAGGSAPPEEILRGKVRAACVQQLTGGA